MPRRPRKTPLNRPDHLFKPGQSGNPAGKPRGTKQITDDIREAFALLLQSKIPELQDWLDRAAKKDPIKALDIFTRISERFVPSLQRTDHHIEGSGVMIPIQINLPQFNVPTSIGEAAPIPLIASPAEEVKALGEGTPTESQPSTDVDMEFTIPKFELSANILRDIQEISEAAPTGGEGPRGL